MQKWFEFCLVQAAMRSSNSTGEEERNRRRSSFSEMFANRRMSLSDVFNGRSAFYEH